MAKVLFLRSWEILALDLTQVMSVESPLQLAEVGVLGTREKPQSDMVIMRWPITLLPPLLNIPRGWGRFQAAGCITLVLLQTALGYFQYATVGRINQHHCLISSNMFILVPDILLNKQLRKLRDQFHFYCRTGSIRGMDTLSSFFSETQPGLVVPALVAFRYVHSRQPFSTCTQ